MTRKKLPAQPFAQLLGLPAAALPITDSAQLVVAGRRIARADQVAALVVDAERDDLAVAEARRLVDEARKAKRRAADKRYREKQSTQAKRKAWMEANPDKLQAYRAKHRKAKGDAWVQQQAQAFQRRYWSDPEAARAKNRAYYHANRERILSAMRARREAA